MPIKQQINMSESPNPYEATLLEDEKPQEKIRFLRVRPKPNKITGSMIQETTWKAFWSNRWRFIGLGLLSMLLIYAPFILFLCMALLRKIIGIDLPMDSNPFFRTIWKGALFFFGGLGLCFWACLICVMAGNWNLRLLRDEKIFRRPTWQSVFRTVVASVNCICYALLCSVILIPAYALLFASSYALDQVGGMRVSNIWLGVFTLGLIAFCLFGLFIFGRYAIGLPYIVDRNVGCLTALRQSPTFCRGYTMTIATSFLVHYFLLGCFGVLTLYVGFLVMPGYLFCWLATTYLLATSQYELTIESDTTEW